MKTSALKREHNLHVCWGVVKTNQTNCAHRHRARGPGDSRPGFRTESGRHGGCERQFPGRRFRTRQGSEIREDVTQLDEIPA